MTDEDRKELIRFLKDNMTIETEASTQYSGSTKTTITIKISGVEICQDYFYD